MKYMYNHNTYYKGLNKISLRLWTCQGLMECVDGTHIHLRLIARLSIAKGIA